MREAAWHQDFLVSKGTTVALPVKFRKQTKKKSNIKNKNQFEVSN